MTGGNPGIAGCSLRGMRHIRDNMPCQDKISRFTSGNVTAVALSDGAGSSRLSHYGAARASGVICRKLCADFGRLSGSHDIGAVKKSLLEYLRHKLSLLSDGLACENEDLQCTLMAVASDGERYISLHIGDGIAGAFSRNEILTLSEPYNDEFQTLTDCIFSPGALGTMSVKRGFLGGISGFVLMSDGTQAGYYDDRRKKFGKWLLTVRRKCFSLEEGGRENYLRSELREAAKSSGTDDDCSIIFMNM